MTEPYSVDPETPVNQRFGTVRMLTGDNRPFFDARVATPRVFGYFAGGAYAFGLTDDSGDLAAIQAGGEVFDADNFVRYINLDPSNGPQPFDIHYVDATTGAWSRTVTVQVGTNDLAYHSQLVGFDLLAFEHDYQMQLLLNGLHSNQVFGARCGKRRNAPAHLSRHGRPGRDHHRKTERDLLRAQPDREGDGRGGEGEVRWIVIRSLKRAVAMFLSITATAIFSEAVAAENCPGAAPTSWYGGKYKKYHQERYREGGEVYRRYPGLPLVDATVDLRGLRVEGVLARYDFDSLECWARRGDQLAQFVLGKWFLAFDEARAEYWLGLAATPIRTPPHMLGCNSLGRGEVQCEMGLPEAQVDLAILLCRGQEAERKRAKELIEMAYASGLLPARGYWKRFCGEETRR